MCNHQPPSHQDVTNTPENAAIFTVLGLNKELSAFEAVKEVCANLPAFVRSLKKRFPDGQISAVMGFGADAWKALFPHLPNPKELQPFKEIKGTKHTAVSTPGDLFFHFRATQMGLCYELAANINSILSDSVYPIDEVQGFRYMDGRTIIGFVDGTENPEDEDAIGFTTIGEEDEFFSGGSYAFVQKYLHNMKAWNDIPESEQERVIGRKKLSDIELSDEEKPANAHNAVTNIEDEQGNELKIMRANMPFANPSKNEYGTYFIGYANTFTTTERMLRNMFIGEPKGNYDRLLDFSTAITGTLFFVPSTTLLETLAEE